MSTLSRFDSDAEKEADKILNGNSTFGSDASKAI